MLHHLEQFDAELFDEFHMLIFQEIATYQADPLALTDPLLSRLPSLKLYRIGLFPRVLPEGYLETLRAGEPRFADPALAAYYARVALVTQGGLFDAARLAEIPRLLFELQAPVPETAPGS